MADGRPAARRLAGVHRWNVPTDVVIDVVAVLAEDIELTQAQNFLFFGLGRGRLEWIHELEELGVSSVVVLIAGMFAARAVAALATHILQVRCVFLISIAGVVIKSRDVADDAFSIKLAQRWTLGINQSLERQRVFRFRPYCISRFVAFLALV